MKDLRNNFTTVRGGRHVKQAFLSRPSDIRWLRLSFLISKMEITGIPHRAGCCKVKCLWRAYWEPDLAHGKCSINALYGEGWGTCGDAQGPYCSLVPLVPAGRGVVNPGAWSRLPGQTNGAPKGVALTCMGVTLRGWEGPGRCGSLREEDARASNQIGKASCRERV